MSNYTANSVLSDVEDLRDMESPSVVICGDYSSGKSSFIKRLLVESGNHVPKTLEVGGDPVTDRVRKYDWEDCVLVDTPGFQADDVEVPANTLEALADGSLVIFLFHPYTITGDVDHLRDILVQSRQYTPGLFKADRSIFLLNRVDDLGVDPRYSPEGFKRIRDSKIDELREKLESIGVDVDDEQVLSVASDPFGMVGNRRDVTSADFDQFRDWDGFDQLAQFFRNILPEIKNEGTASSILEGGLYRVERLIEEYEKKRNYLNLKIDNRQQVKDKLESGLERGQTLRDSQREELFNDVLLDIVNKEIDEIVSAATDEKLEARIENLKELWERDDVEQRIEDWFGDTQRKFRQWFEELENNLQDQVNSRSVKREQELRDDLDIPEVGGIDPTDMTSSVLNYGGKLVRGVNRDVVYKAGKFLGHNFKPWGATKLASKIRGLGPWLNAAGAAMDSYEMYRENKKRAEREDIRQSITEELIKSRKEVGEMIFKGDEEHRQQALQEISGESEQSEVELAPGELFEMAIREIKEDIEEHEQLIEELQQNREQVEGIIEELRTHAEDAQCKLGRNGDQP